MLDVHPPHSPTHTWKDFFIHIATIVVGLLIAIGLEQSVEYLHHRQELKQAREELHEEIIVNRRTSAIQMECIQKAQAELRADTAILIEHRATGKPLSSPLHFDWTYRKTLSAAWRTAQQSGALSLMPHAELRQLDYDFTVGESVMPASELWQLRLETAKAIATRSPDGSLSPADTQELLSVISDTQGKLARTAFLLKNEQAALADTNLSE